MSFGAHAEAVEGEAEEDGLHGMQMKVVVVDSRIDDGGGGGNTRHVAAAVVAVRPHIHIVVVASRGAGLAGKKQNSAEGWNPEE